LTNSRYTRADHEARKQDPYAAAKYRISIEWLRRGGRLDGEIFNIGCGSGIFTAMAADAGARVRAFEPEGSARQMAVESCPPRCTVEALALADIPGHSVASVIVMHDVLEHIADESAAVDDLYRLLQPNGLLVVSVPAMPSLFGHHDEELGHYRRYTKRSLRAALLPHFEIDTLRYFGMTFIPLTLWFSRIRRTPYATGGSDRLLRCFDALCHLEQWVPTPLGTSLLCAARPRSGVRDVDGSGGTEPAEG
jgi:SAM-dependent methyltransferase